MKNKYYTIILLGLINLISCKQSKSNEKGFRLKGTINGSNTEYLVLVYQDTSNAYVVDTIPVVDNSFTTKGSLINPQLVTVMSNLTGRYMEDPNRLLFFLDPGEIELDLKEGDFPNAKIVGSDSQLEKIQLDNMVNPYYDEIHIIRNKRQPLIEKNNLNPSDSLKTEIEQLNKQWEKRLDQIKNTWLKYAIDHPHSYLSGYTVDFYRKTLSKDSLSNLYSTLDQTIKESSYGLQIKEQLDLHIVNSGDVAPSFSYEDIEGNPINLEQFKGKMVLLDFGASWCVPCKKEIPEVKRIFDDYHSKGLEIISVSFDKDKTSWKEQVKNENLDWHHIYEGMENVGIKGSISKSYYVQPIPAYILIDEKGIIIDRYRGADKKDKNLNDLEDKLNSLLNPE
ncbi:TlpA disulfide reductase family protein [Aegicerativicinus sediminis]|uniref:TlpA disulfide reductase family protein n=1 Tax=Aegicerativicinus sediminis TaxID=2893202 RepID=UPI001E5F01F0|nr:TlpA disulfide reductase family protein [Aegicerativicinus sediminis]